MTRPLPSRTAVEAWLAQIQADLEYLYAAETGRSGPYRWARSGLDELRSRSYDSPRGGRAWNVEGEQIPVTSVEEAGVKGQVGRVRRAAYKIQRARDELAAARQILTPRDERAPKPGPILRGWIPQAEHAELVRKQKAREANGGGYGTT